MSEISDKCTVLNVIKHMIKDEITHNTQEYITKL